MPRKPIVVVGENAFHEPAHIAEQFRDQVAIHYEDISSPQKMSAATERADAVVIALHLLDREHIEAMSRSVRIVGRTGVGLDSVDLAAAAACGITVFNEPAYGVVEVASHAVAMILAVQRKLPVSDRFVRSGWVGPNVLSPMKPLDEAVAGVIGCGRIGRATIERLVPLFGEVLFHDPAVTDDVAGARRVERLDDLLGRSDVVTLHTPLTPVTSGLLGRRELSLLPPGATVVNVSRGPLIDEVALAELLESGHIAGAGLDVFATEPLPLDSPLLRAPNTILSPHCASFSDRAALRLATWTITDAIQWLQTGRVRHGAIVHAGTR